MSDIAWYQHLGFWEHNCGVTWRDQIGTAALSFLFHSAVAMLATPLIEMIVVGALSKRENKKSAVAPYCEPGSASIVVETVVHFA